MVVVAAAVPRQQLPARHDLERGQHNTQDGKKQAGRRVAHVSKTRHGDADHNGHQGNLSAVRKVLPQRHAHEHGQGGHQTAHYLVEIDTDVSEREIANGHVETKEDGKGQDAALSGAIERLPVQVVTQQAGQPEFGGIGLVVMVVGCTAAMVIRVCWFAAGVFTVVAEGCGCGSTTIATNITVAARSFPVLGRPPPDRVKDVLTAHPIAKHVNGTEKERIVKVHLAKGGLVGERHANVVERPQHEPETAVVGDKGVSKQQASTV